MNTIVKSAAVSGVEAFGVEVEVTVTSKGDGFRIAGIPINAERESVVRIKSALRSMGWTQRGAITVSLAPTVSGYDAALFDLPIAVGILRLTGAVKE